MKQLIVYDSGHPLERYGKDNDGGYIIADGMDYDCFLSCGIGNDLSFELMFAYLNPVKEAHAFDGSDMFMEESETGIQYHRLNIKMHNSETSTNLHEYLSKHKDVFIKMDIEGYEREWLASLPDNLIANIKQLVIEFHGLDPCLPFIESLNNTHALVHLHGNNFGGVVERNGNIYPNVFECTFVRLKDCLKYDRYHGPLPREIDQPNKPSEPDIDLNFLTHE